MAIRTLRARDVRPGMLLLNRQRTMESSLLDGTAVEVYEVALALGSGEMVIKAKPVGSSNGHRVLLRPRWDDVVEVWEE